jgi:hypothetical protein
MVFKLWIATPKGLVDKSERKLREIKKFRDQNV